MNQTAICNLALLRIGISQQIADITENSTQARACNAVYEHCVRNMLRDRPWPFAVRQVDLALVDEGLVVDWYYSYRYPADFITLFRVLPATFDDDSAQPVVYLTQTRELDPQTYPFKLGSDTSGRLIHTDVPDAIGEGTVYIADTTIWDDAFKNALAWYIAAEIALSLTKNQGLYANAYQRYLELASEGFATACNEQKPRDPADADMIKARE